jgi:hypothetical protein
MFGASHNICFAKLCLAVQSAALACLRRSRLSAHYAEGPTSAIRPAARGLHFLMVAFIAEASTGEPSRPQPIPDLCFKQRGRLDKKFNVIFPVHHAPITKLVH